MTHDELLERLDELKYDVGDSGMNEEYKAIYALRAVVELHKPYVVEHYWADGLETKAQSFCTVCIGEVKSDSIFRSDVAIPVYYPCPTIQKIIENLK